MAVDSATQPLATTRLHGSQRAMISHLALDLAFVRRHGSVWPVRSEEPGHGFA